MTFSSLIISISESCEYVAMLSLRKTLCSQPFGGGVVVELVVVWEVVVPITGSDIGASYQVSAWPVILPLFTGQPWQQHGPAVNTAQRAGGFNPRRSAMAAGRLMLSGPVSAFRSGGK